ncbi:MAG: VCBS repeat-containing protein [Pirellulales bacterium]
MLHRFVNRLVSLSLLAALPSSAVAVADEVQWENATLPVTLTVGYAVRALDMNSDGKTDIAIVDSKRILWLENPTWKEHVIFETPEAKADNVCFAPHDVDGDGLLDFGIGADWQPNNSDSGGSIGWLRQTKSGPWEYRLISTEPTVHRMHWVETAPGKTSLVVAPLKGRGSRAPGFEQTPLRLLAFTPPKSFHPAGSNDIDAWQQEVLCDQLHVAHNFHITDLDLDSQPDLICASYEGATWLKLAGQSLPVKPLRLGTGQEQAPPARGASEIRIGRSAGGRRFLVTIEPWHGDKVVVYVEPEGWAPSADATLWNRYVIDSELAWGHAIAVANLDSDPEDEFVIGVRDNQSDAHRCGVRVYDSTDKNGEKWERTILDPSAVAVEDLVIADFDADGRKDIVAVGRATHNAKIYFNRLPTK